MRNNENTDCSPFPLHIFSCVLVMFPCDVMVVVSIMLFLSGLFLAFFVAGRIYTRDTIRTLVFSVIVLGVTVLLIGCACLRYPVIVVAVSALDIFFVFQTIFWPIALRPMLIRYSVGGCARIWYGIFVLSILVAILSLFIGYPVVYGALYVLFCVVMGHQLGRGS